MDKGTDFVYATPQQYVNQFGAGAHPAEPTDYDDLSKFYTLTEESRSMVPQFRLTGVSFGLQFHGMSASVDPEEVIEHAFKALLDKANTLGDWGSLVVDHNALNTPVYIRFQPLENINPHLVIHELLRIMQSNKEFRFDDKLTVFMTTVQAPSGAGRGVKRTAVVDQKDWMAQHGGRSGCFLEIKNKDNLCFARACVLAKARIMKDSRLDSIRRGDERGLTIQRDKARDLMFQAGLQEHDGPCAHQQWKDIQVLLNCIFH